jgi:hypothetical protein
MKMKKIINIIVFLSLISSVGLSNDKKLFIFLTTTGKTINQAHTEAHNIAYMNGMKIIGRKTIKNGDSWVATVKMVSKY